MVDLVTIDDVSFAYGKIQVLRDITLSFPAGSLVGMIGPNGSGKTTLIRCLCGLSSPARGTITINGIDMSSMKRRELARLMGYVPQVQERSFPQPVFDAVLTGRIPHLEWEPSAHDLHVVNRVLSIMYLNDISHRDINTLSGGQHQRVQIARALAQEPMVLCLDEPTSNLDIKHQLGLMNLVLRLTHQRNTLTLMAIHDLNLASQYCDRLVLLKDGQVFASGTTQQVLTRKNITRAFGISVAIHKHGDLIHIVPVEDSETGKLEHI
ncbi:MAG: ABC transporter ATP-binding protein [Candidatus Krumholzibacteriota bacterium]|nr:ABC transporter ATP-binding protein [Candidatus Krumholzibacteriota bacterium]